MPLQAEQARIVREIDRYLAGKHDADKQFVASSCRQAVPLTMTYRELLAALEAYRVELLRLVGRKNASRWFSHKAGAFDTTLRDAIARCAAPAADEAKLSTTTSTATPATTVKDWNRHGGGRAFVVNGRGFSIDNPTLDQIGFFLRECGITSQPIVDYLCDFANQDGFHAIGHLFNHVMRHVSRHIPSTSGSRHRIDSRVDGKGVTLRDEVSYNALMNTVNDSLVMVTPDFKFAQTYDLVVTGRNVHITNVVYAVEDTGGLTDRLREQAQLATTQIASTVLPEQ